MNNYTSTGNTSSTNHSTPIDNDDLQTFLTEAYQYERPERGDIKMGLVLSLDSRGAIVDLGQKRDGIVPASDLDRLSEEERAAIQVGARVPVYIVQPEDEEGNLVVSFHQALLNRDWIEAERLRDSGEVIEAQVIGTNRGGLIVPFGQIRGFVPASHISGLPHGLSEQERQARLQAMVGQTFGFKIIEVSRRRRRLVLSQREAEKDWRDQRKERLLSELREGQVRTGVVTGLRDFGAFVDLGGADGLIHVSELSWGRVKHPREVLKVGDEVQVYVLRLDPEHKRIALSLKRLQQNPWAYIEQRFYVGQLVEGIVTRITSFGAFVDLGEGIEGLIHSSQLESQGPDTDQPALQEGDRVLVRIISIDSEQQRIGLSMREVSEKERARWQAQHPSNDNHQGESEQSQEE